MYNGIGLQTARGSGTNGYVQTNKFFVRPKTTKVVVDSSKGFGPDQGTGGIGKKANKDILEHDRKRQIELKLTVLEDKLTDQGYSDAEIAEKLKEARAALEAADAVACMDGGSITTEKNVSDTQTHQLAARKEKQLETLRAALGIQLPEAKAEKQVDLDVSEIDDDEPKNYKKDSSEGDGDFEEGEIMHREDGREARSRGEIEDSKIEKKFDKKSRGYVRNGKDEEDREHKKQMRKGMHREDVRKRDFSSSDTESDSKRSSGSDDDSSVDTKRKRKSRGKSKSKKRTSYSSDSSSRSDDSDGACGKRGRQRQIHENKKPVQRGKQSRKERDCSVSSDSDSARVKGREADLDVDIKRKHKSVKTKKSKSKISDDSDYSSDYMQLVDKRRSDDFAKPPRRHDSDSDSDAETKMRHKTEKLEKIKSVRRGKQSEKERHYSVSSDSDSAREKGGEADSDVDIKRKHKSVKSKKGKSRISGGSDYSSDDVQQVDGRRSDEFVKPPRRHDLDSDSDAEIKKHRTEKLEKTKSSFGVVSDYHSGHSEREHRRRGSDESKEAQKRHELDYGYDHETKRKDERERSKIVKSKVASVSNHEGDDLERDYKGKSEKSVKAPTRHDSDADFDSRERFTGRRTQRDDFPVKRRRHDSDDDEFGEAKKSERLLPDRLLDEARDVDKNKDATRGRNNEDDGYRSRVRLEDRDYKRHKRNDREYEDKEPVVDITASRRSDLEYERKHDRGADDYDFRREIQDRRGGGDYRRDRQDKGEQGDKRLGDDPTNGNRDDKEHKRKREDERLYGRDRREEHGSKERGTREEDHRGSRRYDRDRDSSKRSRHEDSRHRERSHHGDDRWRA